MIFNIFRGLINSTSTLSNLNSCGLAHFCEIVPLN